MCVLHENFRVLRQVAGFDGKTGDFVQAYLCENATPQCHLGFCSDCPNYDAMQRDVEERVTSDVKYQMWLTTDRPTLKEFHETPATYWTKMKEYFPKIAAHHFVNTKQKEYITELKEKLKTEPTSVVCTVDYGMNYSFIGQNEPQGAHFSRPQCTVHPFVVDGTVNGASFQKSYVVLSDESSGNYQFSSIQMQQTHA